MFNCAQNFFVDPTFFTTDTYVVLPRLDCYFKSCPPPDGNGASGIVKPGITIYIVGCDSEIPRLDDVNALGCWSARIEWDDINPSNDGTRITTCIFPNPYRCQVGNWYSILYNFDGNEVFEFWENVTGQPIVQPLPFASNGVIGNTASTIISGGPSCKYVGKYYQYAGGWTPNELNSNSSSSISSYPNPQTVPNPPSPSNQSFWNPIPNTCQKFNLYYNRYQTNGVGFTPNNSISGNTAGSTTSNNNIDGFDGCTVNGQYSFFNIPAERMEYLSYDFNNSSNYLFQIGDRIWQEQPFWRGGDGHVVGLGAPYICSVTEQSTNCLAGNTLTDFTQLFHGGGDDEYLVCHSQNHDGPGQHRVECRKVLSFNAAFCSIDYPFSFTNVACWFYKSPACELGHSDFDYFDDYLNDTGIKRGLLHCRNSNANGSHRFVEHSILDRNCVISLGGTGFSNSDWCEITGFEDLVCVVQGHYKAVCNLMTNSTGGVINLFFTNTGCGFANSANLTFSFFKQGGGASNGSGCTITPSIDACYRSERRDPVTLFPNELHFGRLRCLPYDEIYPNFVFSMPDASHYGLYATSAYYRIPNESICDGWEFHRYDDDELPYFNVLQGIECVPPVRFHPIMPSRSKEYMIVTTGCGPALSSTINNCPRYYSTSSNCHILYMNCACASDNTAPTVHANQTSTTFYRYLMNDDYTLENTNYGNCISKQIEKSVTFANNQFAEDIKVWLTAYRPPGSDFKVFVKMFNSSDSDAFDDKDWTLLQDMPSNIGLNSSPTDDTTVVELGYQLGFSPNSAFTLAGSANATSTSSNLVGFGTSWSTNATANVVAGNLVKIYQPLFPNTFQIALVNAVVNDTFITLNDPVVNNSLIGTPIVVDVIGYPHQAFLNQMNDNIIRYYNLNMVPIDTFNTMQIKVCFLDVSGNTAANTIEYLPGVPYIDDIRGVGVSA